MQLIKKTHLTKLNKKCNWEKLAFIMNINEKMQSWEKSENIMNCHPTEQLSYGEAQKSQMKLNTEIMQFNERK